MSIPNPIRIVLAEDHAMMRDGLRSLIRKEENMRIVGEADTGALAVEYAQKLGPHVMILDIGLPDLNGIDATRIILKDYPHIRVIGLSMHADRSLVGEMLKAGACAYVPKDCAYEELIEAIHQAVEGKTYLSPEITLGLVDSFVRNPPKEGEDSAFAVLSERERQVLQLLAEGSATKEIADKLGVSVRTAETHRRNIMDKLDMRSVAELTKYAIRTGLTTLD
ncbi:response regulator transcription factor [Kiritimatiellaeota bacterium B1221]|nr:response regulator transcription factor [Kiritimatiellaeota bacterium B1221]